MVTLIFSRPGREKIRNCTGLISMKTIACNAPYGQGGMGRHLAQVVEEARAEGVLKTYYAYAVKPGDEAHGEVISRRAFQVLRRYTPLRFYWGWRNQVGADLFDRIVARRLTAPLDAHLGFGGRALHSFRRARALGAERLELVAANSHVRNVVQRHTEAIRRYGLEGRWLNEGQCRKTIKEYEAADVIYVASEYTRQSFLAEGVSAGKLRTIRYTVDPHFTPAPEHRPDDGVFRVVYVGSLTVAKGLPVLLEAFARLPVKEAELTLVGDAASPSMRRHLARITAQDPRIRLRPGDPLPHLRRADVCVHPSYEDGFAYAPMEALACGVPVIVTEDTGMKEHVEEGRNGYVVPTGDVEAVIARLEHLKRHPLMCSSV